METFDQLIERRNKANLANRKKHPDWPSHRPTITIPHEGTFLVSETMPEKKSDITAYCKYCYSEHSNWWEMNPEDYVFLLQEGIVYYLCGNCEHTSRSDCMEGLA